MIFGDLMSIKNIITLIIALTKITFAYCEDFKISIQYQNRPPFFIENPITHKLTEGIGYEIIDKILKESKINFVYENKPLVRSLLDIKENRYPTCYPYAYKSKEREKSALFSLPFQKTSKLILAIRKDDLRFKNLNTFKDVISKNELYPIIKIGYNHEKAVSDLLEKYKNYSIYNIEKEKNNKIISTSSDQEEMLLKIIKKEGDYAFFTLNEFEYYQNKNKDIKMYLEYKEITDSKNEVVRHFMCSKKVGIEIINKINLAIKKEVKSL
ncbi:transporter substrate-binding domain-containing protein [Silvanigrella paludirubra]|uniref:Transporter substrate-binding domain-containing protein n=2 Tax=Silvanigrella paludirubra TaxID=2499159 RepID=A0A6N6VT56_9BACT|nr:transporter substrate-binding domain-containing protein [Silvanigrella paludirubra]